MRSSEEIKNIIINKANSDDRIRAVLLNGSRANTKVTPDKFQDFDIVFMVTELNSFIADHSWTNIFGDKLIFQLPNEMSFGNEKETCSFTYLMLFKDGNRIDLTLFPLEKLKTNFSKDSLTIVWVDKGNLFTGIAPSDDSDYIIKTPSEKEFADTCNEFWWVSTYVAKGLLRNEIVYAKEMYETVVRKMFLKMVEWYIGTETDFTVSTGSHGKFIEKYLAVDLYQKILSTYSDYRVKNTWNSLFMMIDLFGQLSLIIADRLGFQYNTDEEINVKLYLRQCYEQTGL
ncbi:MAG: aminoglycoside 6-adenylyltransferase [Bacteroidota bacterium]